MIEPPSLHCHMGVADHGKITINTVKGLAGDAKEVLWEKYILT